MDTKPIIEILDAVHCKANPAARKLILPKLRYKASYFKRDIFGGGDTKIYKKHLITGRNGSGGTFYTGHLPRLKCMKQITFTGSVDRIKPDSRKPYLPGITFRPDQIKALRKARIKQRGRIVFPTGAGKTVVAAGFMSMFHSCRILFLCHTRDLLMQTSEELERFEIAHAKLGAGFKPDWQQLLRSDSCVLISTIQSISKISQQKPLGVFFDANIVDEVHHAAKEDSQYGRYMINSLAPIRLGLTATTPSSEYEELVNEGLFGPVIYEMTPDQGAEIGILAKPQVQIVPIEYDPSLNASINPKTYANYYKHCIVLNTTRNKIIVDKAIATMTLGQSVLIIVEKLEHGRRLQKMFSRRRLEVPFVEGDRHSEFRQVVKNELKAKKIKAAICTRVWKEGINIPSLNHIILAAGMKEEKAVKQAMGRGLRVDVGKEVITLTDFMDPYRHLAEHSVKRFNIYYRLGWLK